MGYRGKVHEQEQARALRASGLTLMDIAKRLDVSKSSVSLWVRDVPFIPSPRRTGAQRRPHPFHERRLAEIAEMDDAGRERIGVLSDEAFLVAGLALYAGEGSKTEGAVRFANTDPAMIRFFCRWMRQFFAPDETRLRMRVYLHEGLDLQATEVFWSDLTQIPRSQFRKAHRPPADPSIRNNRHEHGCAYVGYACSRTHRAVMGMIRALLSEGAIPG